MSIKGDYFDEDKIDELRTVLRNADADLQGVTQRGTLILANTADVRAAKLSRSEIATLWEHLFNEEYKP